MAVAYTHSQGYVHGDLHLGSVLLRLQSGLDRLSERQLNENYGEPDLEPVVWFDGKPLPPGVPSHGVVPIWLGEPSEDMTPSTANILLADWGETFSPSQHSICESHTPVSIRAPEALFEPTQPLSFSSDIWTLACSIWAILDQKPLFDFFLATEDDITCEQVDAPGTLPQEWLRSWEARHTWFTEADRPTDRLVRSLEDRFETTVQKPRQAEGMLPFESGERDTILAMLRSILAFRPDGRIRADEVLKAEWMQKWAIPEYEKIRGRGRAESPDNGQR